MKVLMIKLGATGDVVRTTPLLRRLKGEVTWLTAAKNRCLVDGIAPNVTYYPWEERESVRKWKYDLIISLEDEVQIGAFINSLNYERIFGAALNPDTGEMRYSEDSRQWFDLSLISVHGREEADRLKLFNRRTYQEMIFEGLGLRFEGEEYLLPPASATGLHGDVAIAPVAGPVWPMKAWAYYQELQRELENKGFIVNVLPTRASLLEHLADVQGHRCLVSGDSLPMHLALGSGVPCVSTFNCTSPWEIYDYGIQVKLISPLLAQHFYQRAFDPAATRGISLDTVLDAVLKIV